MPVVKPVETRESRLHTIISYGGTCQDIAKGVRSGCLKRAERSFSQATVCQEWYSMFTLLTVQNSVAIVHAPVGCASSGSTMNIFNRMGQVVRGESRIRNAHWFSTDLQESDIIHGGEAKLRATVLAAEERYHPEAIFVFTSCVSGIIGDPVAEIIHRLQSEVKARLVLSQCEGFRSSVWLTGFDASFHAILNYLVEPPKERDPNLVNVISPLTVGRLDEIELERLLEQIGLKANFIPCYATVDGLRRTATAAATTATCLTYGDYFARKLTERYQIPHTRELMPLGIESTDRWLLQIAELTGREERAKRVIAAEHARIAPRLAELKAQLKGKRVFVSAGQARALSISNFADELGFELAGTTVYQYDEVIAASVLRLAERRGAQGATINIANVQPFEQANLLRRLKPDLYVADEMTTGYAARQGIPTVMIYDYGMTYMGYNGLLATGERMVNALKNPSFAVKLARNRQLPYREGWYEQDPFKYID
jgi:nitrogenase molybdenum-iron protein alpha chain